MSYAFPPDVRQHVQARMASGRYASEDDVLREAFEALTWEEQEFQAVMEAVNALEEGDDGIPLAIAFEQLRQKYGVPSDG